MLYEFIDGLGLVLVGEALIGSVCTIERNGWAVCCDIYIGVYNIGVSGKGLERAQLLSAKCITMGTRSLSWLPRCDGEGHVSVAAGG